jgi:hypothetical protein
MSAFERSIAAIAKTTSGRDFDPISSSCRNNSRNSKGRRHRSPHKLPEKYAWICEPL